MSETIAHLQYMPGDPRLVDQLVYELKSKGIFDQFRKECIADVDTRPAYQNLRQRVESSVASFLARQTWKPDLNKNQLREKLRKHLLDGNYLEQGVERIVDQVVNPKVASVFIPQVEELVYNYLGIPRRKPPVNAESTSTSEKRDLLPTDLEAVSPGSVKSDEGKETEVADEKMEVEEVKDDSMMYVEDIKIDQDTRLSGISELTINDDASIDKSSIPLPTEEIKLENIPAPENSPPNIKKENIDLEKINLPREPNLSTDIPLPDEVPKAEKDNYFKQSEDDDDISDSDSSLRRNMSPLTPIRNFNNENSCDAQQGFENEPEDKKQAQNEPSTFRFSIEAKSSENSADENKVDNKDATPTGQNVPYHFSNQSDFNTPLYDDSSNSNNLQIDYESDVNSKVTGDFKLPETENSVDSKKDKKDEKRSSSHKRSHKSRDSHRSSSSKDKKDHKSSRDSSRHDKKPKDKDSKSHKDKAEPEKKDSKDSKHSSRNSSSSHKSSHKDSKHRSSSSSKHSSSKDDKKSSSSSKDKSEKSSRDKDRSSNSRSSSHSHRSERDKKSEKSRTSDEKENKDKDKKKEKKVSDDHYSVSGRGNHGRRSTDRDSNDGSSSSKGSQNHTAKSSDGKKGSKSTSKSTTSSSTSDSPSDRDIVITETNQAQRHIQSKPIIRVDSLDSPSAAPKRLPFVPDVTIKKPRFASNMEEAKQKMKMRKFFEEEQKRMNQEAALLLEFQANVRPSLSQVYSSIPGPELEFACVNTVQSTAPVVAVPSTTVVAPITEAIVGTNKPRAIKKESHEAKVVAETVPVTNADEDTSYDNEISNDIVAETLLAMHREHGNTANENVAVVEMNEEEDNKSVLETLSESNKKFVENEVVSDKQNISEEIDMPEKHDSSEDTEIPSIEKKPDEKVVEIQVPSEIAEQIDINNSMNFEITIIGEELNEDEEYVLEIDESGIGNEDNVFNTENAIDENSVAVEEEKQVVMNEDKDVPDDEIALEYFAEHEKYKSELETNTFDKFLKSFFTKVSTRKMFLMNCDTYAENVMKDAAQSFGNYEIVTYHKNGHVPKGKSNKKIIKNVNVATEVALPTKSYANSGYNSPMFSPKSEHSFELSSDYDAKLEEMVNNTSRKQIMEIIFGGAVEETPSEMPQIDYCSESKIEKNVKDEKHIETETSLIKEDKKEQIKEAKAKTLLIKEDKKEQLKEAKAKTSLIKEDKTKQLTQAKEEQKVSNSEEIPNKEETISNAIEDDGFDIETAIKVNMIDKDTCRIERDRMMSEKEQEPKQKGSLKRKTEVESSNNNRPILTQKKMRRGSESHQISSTTGEDRDQAVSKKTPIRSKYIGKAKWVGLPRPKKAASPKPSSPSSDKSVENYEQPNNTKTPNGKLKVTRTKVQRYDTSDLYKPKLHYLSRRNNVT